MVNRNEEYEKNMNIDIREYLRTNPISAHEATTSDNWRDCFLYFPNGEGMPEAKTQLFIFNSLYYDIFQRLIEWNPSTGRYRFKYKTLYLDENNNLQVEWDSSAVLSDSQFSNYVRRSKWNQDKALIEERVSNLENNVENDIKKLRRNGILNYRGAIELQSSLYILGEDIYRQFAFRTGHIWCFVEGSNIQSGEDRVKLSETIEHDHRLTSAETMSQSPSTNRYGGQLMGRFTIGDTNMVSSDLFSISPNTYSMMQGIHVGVEDDLTYPLGGENVIDWRNPQKKHNNVPPTYNIYIRCCVNNGLMAESLLRDYILMTSSNRDIGIEETNSGIVHNLKDDDASTAEPKYKSSMVKDLVEFNQGDLTKNDYLLRISIDDAGQVSLNKQTVKQLLNIFVDDVYKKLGARTEDGTWVPFSSILKTKLDQELVIRNEFMQWYNKILDRLEKIKERISLIQELRSSIKPRNYIGRIIISGTDDIEQKVIEHYGGKRWIRLVNFLRGVDKYNPNDIRTETVGLKYGEEFVCLRESSIPLHTHNQDILTQDDAGYDEEYDVFRKNERMKFNRGGKETKVVNEKSENQGIVLKNISNQFQISPLEYNNTNHITIPHDNLPPYREMYMWQCVELTLEEKALEENLCKVTFDGNRGKPEKEISYIPSGEKLERIPTPFRNGYEFIGYFTEKEGGIKIDKNTIVTCDVTYYAHWNRESCIITFHWKDNDNTEYIDKKTIQYDETILDKAPVVTRTGYEFYDWYTNWNGQGQKLLPTDIVTGPADYYANWKKKIYTVTYDAGDGKVYGQRTWSKQYPYGDNLAWLPTASDNIDTSGENWGSADFIGWFTSIDGEEQVNKDTIVTCDVTYYAHWLRYIQYYRVSNTNNLDEVQLNQKTLVASNFKPNIFLQSIQNWNFKQKFTIVMNATTGNDISSNQEVFGATSEDSELEFGVYRNKFMWEVASGSMYTAGSPCDVLSTYYWKVVRGENNSINCYISNNDDDWKLDFSGTRSIDISSKLVLGYDMDVTNEYWRGSIDIGKSYLFKDCYKYVFQPYYTIVNFDANDNDIGNIIETRKVVGGSRIATFPEYALEGKTLTGWFTQKTGGTQITEITCVPIDYSKRSNEITYYAQWEDIKCTVTWETNGGVYVPPGKVKYGDKLSSIYESLPLTTKTGHIFKGWFTSQQFNKQVDVDTIITSDVTYYAKWETATIRVTYDRNGGDTQSRAYDTVKYNGTISSIPTATRTGYTFNNWWTTTTGGEKLTTIIRFTSDVTYYAHWNINKYTVKWNSNGGSSVDDWTNIPYNTKLMDSGHGSTLPTPTKTGYIFVGWKTANGDVVTMNTVVVGNTTYYAQWEPDYITVTFKCNY